MSRYAAIKYRAAKDTRRQVKAEFAAATGTPLKTGRPDNFKDVGAAHPIATRLTLIDTIRKNRTSVIDYGQVTVRERPDKDCDKNYKKALD